MSEIPAAERVAGSTEGAVAGPVTLFNSFVVAPERDAAFKALWDQTSRYFIAQPGFISLRLHRAVSAEAPYRWVNVANWATEADYRAAHATDEFRRVVTQPGWAEFASAPVLFEVETEITAGA